MDQVPEVREIDGIFFKVIPGDASNNNVMILKQVDTVDVNSSTNDEENIVPSIINLIKDDVLGTEPSQLTNVPFLKRKRGRPQKDLSSSTTTNKKSKPSSSSTHSSFKRKHDNSDDPTSPADVTFVQVTVQKREPGIGGMSETKSVNSCLIPLFSCDGWSISTVESLGSRQNGYSKIQEEMVKFGASQCGFCSPGMVMTMSCALAQKKGGQVSQDIEDILDGNICRCTGYRPIIEAFRAASQAQEEEDDTVIDEKGQITCAKLIPATNNVIPGYREEGEEEDRDFVKILSPQEEENMKNIHLSFSSGEEWIVVRTTSEIFQAVEKLKAAAILYKFVAGNTGTGVFKNDEDQYKAFIDLGKVSQLSLESVDADGASLGSGMTIHHTIDFLQRLSQMSGFTYALKMSKHLARIANVSVRNVGTLGGNLMLKHKNPEFPSDIFLLLATLNATLTIVSSATTSMSVSIKDFLNFDMTHQLILSIHLPRVEVSTYFKSFKISRRYQSTHADVNGGFLMKIDAQNNYTVVEKPSIVYGGINSSFIHATATENFFKGKSMKDPKTVEGAMTILNDEIVPDSQLPDASPAYRKLLTQSLLYKFILKILGREAEPKYQMGGKSIKRGKTSSKQIYDTDQTLWPLNKPMAKLEAAAQCSGEAEYIGDISGHIGELFGAFVLSNVANAELDSIDTTAALNLKGVKAVIGAGDVQGENNYMVLQDPEEIFASKKILYAGQSLCLVLAESREIALRAVKLVQIKYKNVQKPILNILDDSPSEEEELVKNNFGKQNGIHLLDIVKGPHHVSPSPPTHVVRGEFKFGGQYHFHMETQSCLCVPKEDGMYVYTATQWMDHVQASIASALAVSSNEVIIQVRRIGGAYGAKISRASLTATACAVAAKKMNRPVRLILDMETNMKMIGKRSPYSARYEVGVDDHGKIQNLTASIFAEVGAVINDADIDDAVKYMQNCYDVTGWTITPAQVITTKAPNTYCRAPGTSQGIAIIENIMDHIAFQLGKDPIDLRQQNFLKDGSSLLIPHYGPKSTEMVFVGENQMVKMIERMKATAHYEKRIENLAKFNSTNRWRKRGMALVPLRYRLDYPGVRFPVYVAIYKFDGTVIVTHGGIEVGQGINTKVAQTVAYMFKIGVEKVRITPSNNIIGANADLTGGSVTSELCCYAATVACQTLLDRMKPVKDKLKNPTWEQIVTACGQLNINLTASHLYTSDDPVKSYDIWGVTLAECEIDCLTGEYKIVRVDLCEDAGRSLNPQVDIGQVEGAFVMAIGWWTTENLIYDPTNGQLLTNRTWTYQPPTAADIPADFRVTLLRKAPNPFGVLRSKAVGEPPLCMGIVIFLALRNAIFFARRDAGNSDYVAIDGPLTQEKILLNCLTDSSQFGI